MQTQGVERLRDPARHPADPNVPLERTRENSLTVAYVYAGVETAGADRAWETNAGVCVCVCDLQNPDPKATDYFASTITKAYEALTDETARENYAKYGHPDGQQSMSVGIALPAFLFDTGKMSPFVLGSTVGAYITIPLRGNPCDVSSQP